MSEIVLRELDREHLYDLRRKGPIKIGPDGVGIPVSVAIRLQMAGLAAIGPGDPQTVTLTRAGRAERRSAYA